VSKNITLTAKFTANTYNYATSLTNVTISDVSGLTADSKATYGQPITFTAKAADGYVLNTVSYQIDEDAAVTLNAVNGTYTIPGDVILGKVTILADATAYYTVTFKAGDGTKLNDDTQDVVAYALTGTSTLYGSYEKLVAGGGSDFTVPTVTASDNTYRLPNADEVAWKDGDNSTYLASAITNLTVEKAIVLTAQAIKTYTVTFEADDHGTLSWSAGQSSPQTVDTGTKWSDVTKPTTTGKDGYTFDKWTWTVDSADTVIADTDTITDNVTVKANFTDASYTITFPGTETGVTVAATTGVKDGKATHNTAVKFTVTFPENKRVTEVSYTIGETAKTLETKESGITSGTEYTIPGDEIVNTVSVNITAADLVTVTFKTDGNGKLNDGDGNVVKTIVSGTALTEDDLPSTSGNTGYVFKEWDTNPVGVSVTTGNTYTFTAKFEKGTYTVTLPDGVSGIASEATYETALTFTPTATGKIITNVTAKIGNTPITVNKNTDGSYTIDGSLITGNITIEATTVEGRLKTISKEEYVALESGKQIVLIETAKLTDDTKYTLTSGGDLYYSSAYKGYVAIVDADLTDAQLASQLSVLTGTATELNYKGDINNSGKTTAADSGIINDILHGATLYYTPDDRMRLELDVTGDQQVTTDDIVWVLREALGLSHDSTSTSENGGD
jgi:uncharacterized repeat protein (TIGR02543 family)